MRNHNGILLFIILQFKLLQNEFLTRYTTKLLQKIKP